MNDKKKFSTGPHALAKTEKLDQLVYTTKAANFLEWLRRWGQKNQLWPFPAGTLCCGMEYHSASASLRGPQLLESPPGQWPIEKSDLMVVVGTVTENLVPYVLEAYAEMNTPKWVIAVGACAASGGPYPTYSVVPGIGQHIPVDVFVPGCPPSPEAILNAVSLIQERVEQGVCAAHGVRLTTTRTS